MVQRRHIEDEARSRANTESPLHAGNPGSGQALVLFDGVCNLCNGSINFIIDRDPSAYFRFAALQSSAATPALEQCERVETSLDSIVLIEEGRCYVRSSAALRIARRLTGAWPLLFVGIIVPAFLRDLIYDVIARNRYRWFGRTESCRIPTPELRSRFLDDPVAG